MALAIVLVGSEQVVIGLEVRLNLNSLCSGWAILV